MRNDYPKVTYRQHTFLSSLVSGLSMIIVILIICVTIIAVYGMNLAGQKSEEIISLAQNAIQGVPAIMESLPPVASDIVNSERAPEYRDNIEITAEPVTMPQNAARLGVSMIIWNKGSMVVSLMSLRIVILDNSNNIISEMNRWVVTPIASDNDWPGPLLPDSKRYISFPDKKAYNIANVKDLKVEVEVTEIRLWNDRNDEESQPMDPNFPDSIVVEKETLPVGRI